MMLPRLSRSLGGLGHLIRSRAASSSPVDTATEFSNQWTNPSDVLTVLMIIGGDVVQTALAQTTGKPFTPVCFSFGWVSYAFTTLVNIVGHGRLLPPPDYPVKVFNLESGYCRDNKNWVIGRILRDNEAWIAKHEPLIDRGMRIAIFEAEHNPNGQANFAYTRLHLYGALTMILQLLVASIPIILHREWSILLITGAGTLLALITGSLPQWTAEKLPNRQASRKAFALTTGNGSKDVMIIRGGGRSLDLEELAAGDSPRDLLTWSKFMPSYPSRKNSDEFGLPSTISPQSRQSRMIGSVPRAFWITRFICALLSILWLVLLISVAGLKLNAWYLLAVGGIGMFQNAFLAAIGRDPKYRNLPLRLVDTIVTPKVMDGLMDLEVTHRWGKPLLREFFPGQLRPEEEAWWKGETAAYDDLRTKERNCRGPPRSKLPNYKLHTAQSIGNVSVPSAEVNEKSHYHDPANPLEASRKTDSAKASPNDLSIPPYQGREEARARMAPAGDEQESDSLSHRSSFQQSLAPSSTRGKNRGIDRTTGFASFLNGLDSEPVTVGKDGSELSRAPYWA